MEGVLIDDEESELLGRDFPEGVGGLCGGEIVPQDGILVLACVVLRYELQISLHRCNSPPFLVAVVGFLVGSRVRMRFFP
jgi:hypothetical protein